LYELEQFSRILYTICMHHPLRRIYGVSFIFALNIALTAYINSTFLSQFFSERAVGFLFAGAALLTIIALEILPLSIEKIGARITTGFVLLSSLATLIILTNANDARSAGLFFVLYTTCNTLAIFCFDIFIGHFSKRGNTGNARGSYLTITNLGWLASPFLAGFLVSHLGYSTLYSLVAGLVTLALATFVVALRHYEDAEYVHRSPFVALKKVRHMPNIIRILTVNFLLQFFFSWMIIFTPVYLHEIVGLPFDTIGKIFTVMLLPFVLLSIPLGRVADRTWGEKEILIAGITIMGIATWMFASYGGTSTLVFAAILFFTRVGAASVETMCETYFFKEVSDKEPDVVSLFRTTVPLAFMIGPLVATLLLAYASHTVLFYSLGCIVLLGLIPALALKDTK
jgi:MFS family permease